MSVITYNTTEAARGGATSAPSAGQKHLQASI